ncbi:MAG TPA: carboxylesterase, partial [Ignavibacteriales bacterium]|nr:carboxylesterase [Ignavibacteriales bacterium]
IAAPASARYLIKHLGSADKRLVWLEQSHHLMMYDDEKDKVFRAVREFLV